MFDAVALQRAKVVTIAQLDKKGLKNCPVPIATCRTVFALKIRLDISLDAVVVEKCIVDVDQEYDLIHRSYPYATPCTMLSVRLSNTQIFQDWFAPTGVSKSRRAKAGGNGYSTCHASFQSRIADSD